MITKAIIPVAGLGTRFLPASKSIPKEMVTIVDKPAIHYVVNEAIEAGAKTIILVTNSDKGCIEDYFERDINLEKTLHHAGKDDIMHEIQRIIPQGISVVSVRQHSSAGLGDAILCAKDIIGNESFMVLLPDMVMQSNKPMVEMVHKAKTGFSPVQVMVHSVDENSIDQYGIVVPNNGEILDKSIGISDVIEKPNLCSVNSNLAMVGRYVLPSRIMKMLSKVKPDESGEYQLTDAIKMLKNELYLSAYVTDEKVFNCGSKLGYLESVLHFGINHDILGSKFKSLIKNLTLEVLDE